MDVVGRQLVLLRQLDDPGEQARWRLFAVHESREPVADVGDIRVGPGGLWLRLFAGDPCRRRRFLGRDLGCDSRVSASLRRFLAKRGENQLVGASLSNDSLQSDSLWVTDLSRGGVTDLSPGEPTDLPPGGAPQPSPPPLPDPAAALETFRAKGTRIHCWFGRVRNNGLYGEPDARAPTPPSTVEPAGRLGRSQPPASPPRGSICRLGRRIGSTVRR